MPTAQLFLKIIIACCAVWAAMAHVSCYAAELAYPKACYSEDELAAVRSWEKTWAR